MNQNFEILKVLKQVKVNIPLLDAIKQISSYVRKKVFFFLTEQVTAIIQNNRPHKFKDPGCPTISCVIGNSKIEKALPDLAGKCESFAIFSV